MSVRFPVAICLCAAFDLDAHELRDAARGLQVRVEEVDGSVAVNGLPFSVSRVTGPDVTSLATRLVARWHTESGPESVGIIKCCGWVVASRLRAGVSQVIQWRHPAGGELLWSTANIAVPAGAVPAPKTPRIADCTWGTLVHGHVARREFLQVSAHCNLEPSRALDLSARRLTETGWKWQRRSPLVLQAERGSVQTQLTAGPAPLSPGLVSTEQSSLVLIESQPVEGVIR